ncbi:glycosyltransferase family 2 protein [Methanophagales archaeon]|nr:MAG: glycosyltransferase family 2 protein [Methanophagales archaeon]
MSKNLDLLRRYILITPAKNEEKNLPNLISSVLNQTNKPILWVIVDDGSEDNTPDIIMEAKRKHSWIQNVHLEEHPRDIGKRYAYVCNRGFDYALKYLKKHDLKYEYIGVLDADMILEHDFYSRLIEEFEKNPKLGIASGGEYFYDADNKLVLEEVRDETPVGCMRLWRRECFEEVGMYPISYSPDSVSNVLAKLRGWEIKMFREIKAIQTRRTSSAEGLWKGYKIHGESAYFRNYHPLFAMAKGLKYLSKRPYYTGIAYLYGYFSSFLKRMDKIDNKEVRDYYWNKHKEVAQFYWAKLKNKLLVGNNEKM